MKHISLLLLLAAALVALSAPVHAATTTVAPGTATLAAAIAAATAGDVLELTTGDYDSTGTLAIGKNLTIRAQAGQTPVFKPTAANMGSATRAMQVTTANITFVWDGINMVLDMPLYGGLFFAGANDNITVQNCSITDTANNTSASSIPIWSSGKDAVVTFNNCNISFVNNTKDYWRAVWVGDGANSGAMQLIFKKCSVTINGSGSNYFHNGTGATLEFDDCMLNFNQPRINIGIWAGYSAAPNVNVVLRRTVIDSGNQAIGYGILYNEAFSNFTVENCAILYKHKGHGIYTGYLTMHYGGTASIKYNTFIDKDTDTGAYTFLMLGNAVAATVTGDYTVQNNIFVGAPGSTPYYLTDYAGSDASKLTYTVGKNLVSIAPQGTDKISGGTVVVGDPKLTATPDVYHLTKDSTLARGAAVDIGIISDIDGGERPYYGGFDLGCDQYATVPVELSTFSAE